MATKIESLANIINKKNKLINTKKGKNAKKKHKNKRIWELTYKNLKDHEQDWSPTVEILKFL